MVKFNPKILIVSLTSKLVPKFKYAEFNGDVYSFNFRPEIPIFGKLGPNNQNYSLSKNLAATLI